MLSSSSLSFIFVAGALAVAPAQDLFAPSFPVVAYPVTSAADVTTYLVGCTAGSDTKTCNFAQPYTLVQGPNTVDFTLSIPGQVYAATIGCDLNAKTSMSCVATGAAADNPATTLTATTSVTGSAAETHFRAITIVTAAGDLLTYPVPTTSSTPTSTSHSTTTPSSASTYSKTPISHNSTTIRPTITSAPLATAPIIGTGSATAPANNTASAVHTPAVSSASQSSYPSDLPNAGMLSASSNFGGVIGVVAAVGAFFLAGAL